MQKKIAGTIAIVVLVVMLGEYILFSKIAFGLALLSCLVISISFLLVGFIADLEDSSPGGFYNPLLELEFGDIENFKITPDGKGSYQISGIATKISGRSMIQLTVKHRNDDLFLYLRQADHSFETKLINKSTDDHGAFAVSFKASPRVRRIFLGAEKKLIYTPPSIS